MSRFDAHASSAERSPAGSSVRDNRRSSPHRRTGKLRPAHTPSRLSRLNAHVIPAARSSAGSAARQVASGALISARTTAVPNATCPGTLFPAQTPPPLSRFGAHVSSAARQVAALLPPHPSCQRQPPAPPRRINPPGTRPRSRRLSSQSPPRPGGPHRAARRRGRSPARYLSR